MITFRHWAVRYTFKSMFVLSDCFPRPNSQTHSNPLPLYLYRINVSMGRQLTKPTVPIECTQLLNKTGVCFRPSLGLVASIRKWIRNGVRERIDLERYGEEGWTWKHTNNPHGSSESIDKETMAVFPVIRIFSTGDVQVRGYSLQANCLWL